MLTRLVAKFHPSVVIALGGPFGTPKIFEKGAGIE